MAIPGRNYSEQVETRAKVRCGIKVSGKPRSVDYFVSDDPEVQGQPKQLRVRFPYATADENFSTGLEFWTKASGKNLLGCYTKDGGHDPIALRYHNFVADTDVRRGEQRGERVPISCPGDNCPLLKDKKCKPMGRLVFFIDGGRTDEALQLDTKSWYTIEELTPALTSAEKRGPLNGDRVFLLSVAFKTKGTSRFPVLSIEEATTPITTEADVDLADACLKANTAISTGDPDYERVALAELLDAFRPGWRDDQAYIDRIKEVGVEAALCKTLEAAEAKLQ